MDSKDLAIVSAATLVLSMAVVIPAYATHDRGIEDFENHTWSRNSNDGHTGYLNCGTGSQSSYCALKIKTTSGVQEYSQDIVNTVVDDVEDHFDSLGKKMSIDRTFSANSTITEYNLKYMENGRSDYTLHCVQYHWLFWWICEEYDEHFVKITVKLNDNPADTKFKLTENENSNPKEYALRKTLGHELFHAMGIDHNSPSESIVFYLYEFGANVGYEATVEDIQDLEDRYP